MLKLITKIRKYFLSLIFKINIETYKYTPFVLSLILNIVHTFTLFILLLTMLFYGPYLLFKYLFTMQFKLFYSLFKYLLTKVFIILILKYLSIPFSILFSVYLLLLLFDKQIFKYLDTLPNKLIVIFVILNKMLLKIINSLTRILRNRYHL